MPPAKPTWGKKPQFPDPFGGKVFVTYGGGDCVTIMQEGSKGAITVGKDRALAIANDIFKKLKAKPEEPETITQGELPF